MDLERNVLHLPNREVPLSKTVRTLLLEVQRGRKPGAAPNVLLSPNARNAIDEARLSNLTQTALIRAGLEGWTLRSIRAAGIRSRENASLLEFLREKGRITRQDVEELLGLSKTAAYMRLRGLEDAGAVVRVGNACYLPGTVVPEEEQWPAIADYLNRMDFAFCQDIAGLLGISRSKCSRLLRGLVEAGKLECRRKRYYLPRKQA